MLQSTKPTIVCLQETKLNAVDERLALEFLGPRLCNFDFLAADGTRGGIMLTWDADYVQVDDLVH